MEASGEFEDFNQIRRSSMTSSGEGDFCSAPTSS